MLGDGSVIMRGMRNHLASALTAIAVLVTLTGCGFSSLQQQPPPTPTASPSATPTHRAGPIQIPTNWVSFSWHEAGFSVRLPSKPTKSTVVRYLRGVPFVVRFAVVKDSPGPIEIGTTVAGVGLTPKAVGDELAAFVKNLATSTGSVVTSQHATKFRKMRAFKAILSRGTQNFEALVFQQTPSREVFVFALEGDVFEAVTTSLRLTAG